MGVPSVQASSGDSATSRSITRCTPEAAGQTLLRMVVAPGATPVSSMSLSADANETRGMPRAAQKSRVTKGFPAGMT